MDARQTARVHTAEPRATSTTRQAWPQLRRLQPLRLVGLMTIPPLGLNETELRQLFRDCAALAAELELKELSMGMSGDWRPAVAAGSTWVRLGSGLFGARPGAASPGPRGDADVPGPDEATSASPRRADP